MYTDRDGSDIASILQMMYAPRWSLVTGPFTQVQERTHCGPHKHTLESLFPLFPLVLLLFFHSAGVNLDVVFVFFAECITPDICLAVVGFQVFLLSTHTTHRFLTRAMLHT